MFFFNNRSVYLFSKLYEGFFVKRSEFFSMVSKRLFIFIMILHHDRSKDIFV